MTHEPRHAEKQRIRTQMAARRKAQPPATALAHAAAAQEALMAHPAWRDARQVVLYMAFRGEVGTELLLHEAWASGRQVLLPRCCTQTKGHMDLALCQCMQDVQPGQYGILEPCPARAALDWDDAALNPDVVVVPGVAFDRHGHRLGYGGGYYDRMLTRPALQRSVRVGLAFGWQILDSLPVEPWDCPVTCLCTEEGLAWM